MADVQIDVGRWDTIAVEDGERDKIYLDLGGVSVSLHHATARTLAKALDELAGKEVAHDRA
jgi:hypothetical protein